MTAEDEASARVVRLLEATPGVRVDRAHAGRLRLVVVPALGDRAGRVVLGEWPVPPILPLAVAALKARPEEAPGDAWLFVQGASLLVAAATAREGARIVELADRVGFHASALREERGDGSVLVEIASRERIETPLMDEDALAWLWPRAQAVWRRGRDKLERLEDALTASSREASARP